MGTALYVGYDATEPFDLDKTTAHLVFLFAQECGFRPLPWMSRAFRAWLDEGFDPALIEEAIQRTSYAPRPSYAYLRAIMDSARRMKTFDLHEFLTEDTRRHAAEGLRNPPNVDYKYSDWLAK